MHEARKYDATKRVLPFVTPGWNMSLPDGGTAFALLTYEEMSSRLSTLEALGADGCTLWISSSARDPSTGQRVVLNPTAHDWFGAVVDFAASH